MLGASKRVYMCLVSCSTLSMNRTSSKYRTANPFVASKHPTKKQSFDFSMERARMRLDARLMNHHCHEAKAEKPRIGLRV